MERMALCMICQQRPAGNSCSMCGRVVCDEHYDSSTGLCSACKRGKSGKGMPEGI